MAQENWQKIKILKLLELLQQQTDDQKPLTTTELCTRMEKQGIPCDRRTLSKDIALLNEQGYEIMWRWVGKEKGYYILDRSFSVPELKILIDAVQAASFVTEKKTAELIEKIADLGGSHRGDILKSNVVHFVMKTHPQKGAKHPPPFGRQLALCNSAFRRKWGWHQVPIQVLSVVSDNCLSFCHD